MIIGASTSGDKGGLLRDMVVQSVEVTASVEAVNWRIGAIAVQQRL